MDSKRIAVLILIFAIVCAAAFLITAQHNSTQKNITSTNNATNITKNTTNVTNVTNATPENEYSSQTTSERSASTHESDPEFGTDEYVDRWDESLNPKKVMIAGRTLMTSLSKVKGGMTIRECIILTLRKVIGIR